MENIMMLPASYCVMNEEEMTYTLSLIHISEPTRPY